MNQQMSIARLKSLLERVQTRAKQERKLPSAQAAAPLAERSAVAQGPAIEREAAPLPPVVMALTADSTETDETRPFAKLTAAELAMPLEPSRPRVAHEATPLVQHRTDRPPPPALELESLEPEPVALEPMEAEAVQLEAPASSRRPAQERELEPEELLLEAEVAEEKHDTEPPKSGPQLLEQPIAPASATGFEVDFDARQLDRAAAETPALPSIAQLGQMVELDELPESAHAGIELAPPPAINAPPSTLHEMEASLPAPERPGVYSPELAPTARASEVQPASAEGPFGAEPGTTDWDMPSQKEVSGVIDAGRAEAAPAPVVEEKPAVEQKPAAAAAAAAAPAAEPARVAEPTLESVQEAAAVAPQAEPEALPATGTLRLVAQRAAKPVELEVVPIVVGAKQVAAADVAVFMGAVKEFKPSTFVEWLDAALDLGKK